MRVGYWKYFIMKQLPLLKIIKWISLLAFAAMALLQLTNPARTNPPVTQDFLAVTKPPPDVAALFRVGCYDCHSHETHWPWYSHIAPVSWGVVGDVNQARSHVDLSVWPTNNADAAIRKLQAMSEELQSGRMPLPHYTLVHREARLTVKQRGEMADWLGSVATALEESKSIPTTSPVAQIDSSAGRALFLKNCAHCHGADGHGDDGPDLHNLDLTDARITQQIRNGKKGQMTSFAGKLDSASIQSLVEYLRTLK